MTEPSEKGPEVHLLFVGLREQLGTEPSAMFATLTPEEVQQQELLHEVKQSELQVYSLKFVRAVRLCKPGAVYKVTKTANGISYMKKAMPEFVLRGEQITRWAIQHRAVEQNWGAVQRQVKEARSQPDRALLDPFREAYWRLSGVAQAQLIADVAAYISRGRPKKSS